MIRAHLRLPDATPKRDRYGQEKLGLRSGHPREERAPYCVSGVFLNFGWVGGVEGRRGIRALPNFLALGFGEIKIYTLGDLRIGGSVIFFYR